MVAESCPPEQRIPILRDTNRTAAMRQENFTIEHKPHRRYSQTADSFTSTSGRRLCRPNVGQQSGEELLRMAEETTGNARRDQLNEHANAVNQ